ncbi:MAG: mechanosensitive ion channel domain-containing protein, partial [Nanoarchaeota archaeon]
ILGRILGKVVEKLFRELKVGESVQKRTGMKTSFDRIASSFVSFGIYIVFFILALNKIGVTTVFLNIVAIIILIVLALSILLSIKDSVPNIIAYRKIAHGKDMSIGDTLTIQHTTGKIIDMTVFEIKIETDSGDILHLPNSLLMNEPYTVRRSKRSS